LHKAHQKILPLKVIKIIKIKVPNQILLLLLPQLSFRKTIEDKIRINQILNLAILIIKAEKMAQKQRILHLLHLQLPQFNFKKNNTENKIKIRIPN